MNSTQVMKSNRVQRNTTSYRVATQSRAAFNPIQPHRFQPGKGRHPASAGTHLYRTAAPSTRRSSAQRPAKPLSSMTSNARLDTRAAATTRIWVAIAASTAAPRRAGAAIALACTGGGGGGRPPPPNSPASACMSLRREACTVTRRGATAAMKQSCGAMRRRCTIAWRDRTYLARAFEQASVEGGGTTQNTCKREKLATTRLRRDTRARGSEPPLDRHRLTARRIRHTHASARAHAHVHSALPSLHDVGDTRGIPPHTALHGDRSA